MSKTTLKLGKNQKSELKELDKQKNDQPQMYTLKQVSNPTLAPHVADMGPKKEKNYPKIRSTSKVIYE